METFPKIFGECSRNIALLTTPTDEQLVKVCMICEATTIYFELKPLKREKILRNKQQSS